MTVNNTTVEPFKNNESVKICEKSIKIHDLSLQANTNIRQVNCISHQTSGQLKTSKLRSQSRIPVKIKINPMQLKSSTKSESLTIASAFKSSFKSRIPKFRFQKQQKQSLALIDVKQNLKSNQDWNNCKCNSFTKTKTTNISPISITTSIINSQTFDKNPIYKNEENQIAYKLHKNEARTILTNSKKSQVNVPQNVRDVIFGNNAAKSEESQAAKKTKNSSRIKDDEGYSTMSSELMHQIKQNSANQCIKYCSKKSNRIFS